MKNTRKKLFISLVCMLITLTTLLGSTYAWFTDSVSNTGNRIQAGTLKIDLLKYDEGHVNEQCDGYITIANQNGDIFNNPETNVPIALNSSKTIWEPGKTQIVYLAVENTGNLALKYTAYIDVTDEGLCDDPDTEDVDSALECVFLPVSYVEYKEAYSSLTTWAQIKEAATNAGIPVQDVYGGRNTITTGVLDEVAKGTPNERDYVALVVHMKEDAGNAYQDKDAIIDVTISATQYTAELDGFDNANYDASAAIIEPATAMHSSVSSEALIISGSGTTIDKIGDESATGKENVDIDVNVRVSTEGNVKASLPIAAAQDVMDKSLSGKNVDTEKDREMVLILNVESVNTSALSTTYDINVTANITYTDTNGELQTIENQEVNNLSKFLTATMEIGKNLSNVTVTHSGNTMTKINSESDIPENESEQNVNGYYNYKASTGVLTIWSKSFSPFEITFDLPFAGGEGTEDNPYLVSDAKQFNNIINGTSANKKYYKLTSDIDLSSATVTSANAYGFNSLKGQLLYAEIDGDGHTIKSTNSDTDTIFGDLYKSTLKNMTFDIASPISGYLNSSSFENVEIKTNTTLYFGNNTGIVGIYCYSATLDNVDITANVVSSSYSAVYFGYNFGGTYILNNCSFTGYYVGQQSGLVLGNPCYSAATIIINNFTNNGVIRHTLDSRGKDFCIYGICDDGKENCGKVVTIDGVDYSGSKSKDIVLTGAGEYVVGPVDQGLGITVNPDKTFTISKSADQNVAYYVFEIVANVPYSSGSTNISVEETIVDDGSATYVTTLKDYGFANGDAATSKLNSYDIINIAGVDYYWDSNSDHDCSVRGKNTMIFVRAYNSEDSLISVAAYGSYYN